MDAWCWPLAHVQLLSRRRLCRLCDFICGFHSRLVCQLGQMDGCRTLVSIRVDGPECVGRGCRRYLCLVLASKPRESDGFGKWIMARRIRQLHWPITCPHRYVGGSHLLGSVCPFPVDDRSLRYRPELGIPKAKTINGKSSKKTTLSKGDRQSSHNSCKSPELRMSVGSGRGAVRLGTTDQTASRDPNEPLPGAMVRLGVIRNQPFFT